MNTGKKMDLYAKWTLAIGTILIFILPFTVSILNIEFLGNYSGVGDTIGGITSPISQVLGSVLIYLALKAQLDANWIVQNQIDKDNVQSIIRHDIEQINELYALLQNNINHFSYEQKSQDSTSVIHGKRGIKQFFNDIEESNIDMHVEKNVLRIDGVREIISIINSAKLILQKVTTSNLDIEDKNFYNTLIYHEVLYSILPASEIVEEDPLALKKCTVCNINHGNFPPIIFHKIQDLKEHF